MAMAQMNPMTQAPTASPMTGTGTGPGDLARAMEQQHSAARAKLDKVEEIATRQRAVREQLEHLTTLGDLVNEEDVVKSASKIVATGVPPMAVATLLSDMPTTGGEALASWISGQEEQFAMKEQQLNQVLTTMRYETGLAALRMLSAEHFGGMGDPGTPQGAGNPLMPGTPSLSPAPLGVDASAPPLSPSMSAGPGAGVNELTGD